MFPPPYSSGLWSKKQREHWPFVLHINGNRTDLGAVPPAKLSAGNLGSIGLGSLNPAFQRSIILNSGLAYWYPMAPEANWTILGTRRSMIALGTRRFSSGSL